MEKDLTTENRAPEGNERAERSLELSAAESLRQEADLSDRAQSRSSENSNASPRGGNVAELVFDNSIYPDRFSSTTAGAKLQESTTDSTPASAAHRRAPDAGQGERTGEQGTSEQPRSAAQERLDNYIREAGFTREIGRDGVETLIDQSGLRIQLRGGSPEFQERMLRELRRLPLAERRLLADANARVAIVTRISDIDPRLAHEQPRGWPAGRTWDDVDGGFIAEQNLVIIAEKTRRGRNERGEFVLRHEAGHAVDSALRDISRSPEFQRAYERDVQNLTPEQRRAFTYLLQRNGAGAEELFADLYAAVNGSAAERDRYLRAFPNTAAIVIRELQNNRRRMLFRAA